MKISSWILSISIGLGFIYVTKTYAGQIRHAKLVVNVSGIKGNSGTVKIGLFNTRTGFPNIARISRGVNKKARKGKIVGVFTKLPAGLYAVAVIHDENNNGVLDKNLLGLPREGYGISRNIRPRLKAPKFSAASIRLDGKTKHITIDMRY